MVRTTAAKVKAFDVKISKQSHAISMGLSMVMEDPEGSQNRTENPLKSIWELSANKLVTFVTFFLVGINLVVSGLASYQLWHM